PGNLGTVPADGPGPGGRALDQTGPTTAAAQGGQDIFGSGRLDVTDAAEQNPLNLVHVCLGKKPPRPESLEGRLMGINGQSTKSMIWIAGAGASYWTSGIWTSRAGSWTSGAPRARRGRVAFMRRPKYLPTFRTALDCGAGFNTFAASVNAWLMLHAVRSAN